MLRSARSALGALLTATALAGLTGCAELATPSASAGTTVADASAGSGSAGPPSPVPSSSAVSSPAPEPSPPRPDPEAAGTALAALAGLEVKGRAPQTGYDRELFGSGWGDPDRNGCDARNDVLARDLTGKTFKPGTRNCVVAAGTLVDPFSGAAIDFRRGQDTSDDVQIDHVVALSDAW